MFTGRPVVPCAARTALHVIARRDDRGSFARIRFGVMPRVDGAKRGAYRASARVGVALRPVMSGFGKRGRQVPADPARLGTFSCAATRRRTLRPVRGSCLRWRCRETSRRHVECRRRFRRPVCSISATGFERSPFGDGPRWRQLDSTGGSLSKSCGTRCTPSPRPPLVPSRNVRLNGAGCPIEARRLPTRCSPARGEPDQVGRPSRTDRAGDRPLVVLTGRPCRS